MLRKKMNAFIRKASRLIQSHVTICFSSANSRSLVVFFHLLKSLYALILFLGLFLFFFLLQFPGCIAEVQIYIILIGRNFFREQFAVIHSKTHENVTLF